MCTVNMFRFRVPDNIQCFGSSSLASFFPRRDRPVMSSVDWLAGVLRAAHVALAG